MDHFVPGAAGLLFAIQELGVTLAFQPAKDFGYKGFGFCGDSPDGTRWGIDYNKDLDQVRLFKKGPNDKGSRPSGSRRKPTFPRLKFRFAKTMPAIPHFYVVRSPENNAEYEARSTLLTGWTS